MRVINPFVLKKWAALFLVGLFTVISFYVGLSFYGLMVALLAMIGGLLFAILIANKLLNTPFRMMTEGKGLMCFKIDSTGIIVPFIVNLNTPVVSGAFGGKMVKDVFDRNSVMQMAPPHVNQAPIESEDDGSLVLRLDQQKFADARMALNQYPVLLYNAHLKSFITKDWLSGEERKAFAEHGVLQLQHKLEDLDAHIRDFGRSVVELLKPTKDIFKNKWVWFIFITFGLIALMLFGQPILESITTVASGTAKATASAGGGGVVTPR